MSTLATGHNIRDLDEYLTKKAKETPEFHEMKQAYEIIYSKDRYVESPILFLSKFGNWEWSYASWEDEVKIADLSANKIFSIAADAVVGQSDLILLNKSLEELREIFRACHCEDFLKSVIP